MSKQDARNTVKPGNVMLLWCRHCNSQVKGQHMDECPKGGKVKHDSNNTDTSEHGHCAL